MFVLGEVSFVGSRYYTLILSQVRLLCRPLTPAYSDVVRRCAFRFGSSALSTYSRKVAVIVHFRIAAVVVHFRIALFRSRADSLHSYRM